MPDKRAFFIGRDQLFVVVDNQSKLVSFQRCAANEAAVNLGLSHQSLDIGGFHGTAILNSHSIGNFLAITAFDRLANDTDGLVRLLIRSNKACADSPNRFVCNDDPSRPRTQSLSGQP